MDFELPADDDARRVAALDRIAAHPSTGGCELHAAGCVAPQPAAVTLGAERTSRSTGGVPWDDGPAAFDLLDAPAGRVTGAVRRRPRPEAHVEHTVLGRRRDADPQQGSSWSGARRVGVR